MESRAIDEDQIALVILDLSNFVAWVSIILGTPTICQIVNMIKEKEIDVLVMPWVNAQVAHPLAMWQATATVEDDQLTGESDLSQYYEVVITKDTETIDALSSHIIPVKTGTAYTGERVNVMTQALHTEDGSLPQCLTMQNAYMQLRKGSKNVAVVVRNSMPYPQTLRKKTLAARAVVATRVPRPPVWTGMVEELGRLQCSQMPKLTVKQRQEKLFKELGLQWFGILATRIGRFCQISLGQIPCLGAQWAWLYSFGQTCDQSYW